MRPTLLALTCIIGLGMNAQTFTQMTSILNGTSSSGEPCSMDMNGDHLDDIVRYTSGLLIIDFQQPDGTFIEYSYPAGIDNYPTWSVAGGDLDGNGFNDLILGSGSEISFVYANDDGTAYNEVNVDDYIFTQRTNMVDIDNDGNLDAFACHDVDQSHPFRNDGSGNMTEDQSLITTVPVGGNYASVWCDFDNDGDVDMYMSKCRSGAAPTDPQRINGMYQNNGDGTFTEMAASINMADNDQSWVTIFEDFDNDGDFDTYTVNHANSNRLMENDGSGYYTNVTAGSGIDATDLDSWACIGADFDNDGYVDILTQSFVNKEFYHNDGNMQFTPMSMPFDDGSLCDLNDDGFLDVWTGGTVWMNDGNLNNWVKFSLDGIVSNSNGIGSRITIYGDWGTQIRECRSGQSFAPMSTLNVHFGLGSHTVIDSVHIAWPSGITTALYDLNINQLHVVPEASCVFDAADVNVSGPTQICPGDIITLTAPTGYDYMWSTGEDSQTITVNSAGNYSVTMTDGSGCLDVSDMVVVSMVGDETPTLTLEGDEVFCAGDQAVLSSSEASAYLWSTEETTQSITIEESGTYSVTIEGQCGTAVSEELTIEVLSTTDPIYEDLVVSSPGDYDISAEGPAITWYEDEAGTTVLGTGNDLNVTVPESGTTVYVSNATIYEGISESGGKADNSGGGGLPSTGAYSYFDVWEAFTLDQVTVYVVDGLVGNRTFQLVDADENILESGVYDLADGMNVVDLGWDVPVGVDLSLRCVENNLFRNNGGVSYPYAIGTAGEIHSSFFGQTYYYYFYDWKTTRGDFHCESDILPFHITLATGLEEHILVDGIETFPNPVTDQVQLSLTITSAVDLSLVLLDTRGAIIVQRDLGHLTPGEFRTELDLSTLPSAQYEMQLIDENGHMSTTIIKQ